ncbi:hypothetical protein N9597_00120 [Candidatus Marinimicrobia bacterium]|nr:hypothetical protein [Candidatus Neomarinimicrobiota bacterium]
MKTLIKILCLSVLWFSCENEEKKSISDYDKIISEVKTSGRYGKINDIFLGFKFGDSKNEVENKLSNLYDEGKIYLNDNYQYAYLFKDEHSEYFNAESTIKFEYHNDKLYSLSLFVNPTSGINDYQRLQLHTIYTKLFIKYVHKYILNDYEEENYIEPDKPIRYYFDGNCQVKLEYKKKFILIEYFDLTISSELNEITNQKRDKQFNKTLEDI